MARDIILLECKNCGNRNYATTKNKKLHQERLVLRKYCKHCRKHTEHKEVK